MIKLTKEARMIRETLKDDIVELPLWEMKELVDYQIYITIPKEYWESKNNCMSALQEIMDDLNMDRVKLISNLKLNLLKEYGFESMLVYFGSMSRLIQELFDINDDELIKMNRPPVNDKYFESDDNIKYAFGVLMKRFKIRDCEITSNNLTLRRIVERSIIKKMSSKEYEEIIKIATGKNFIKPKEEKEEVRDFKYYMTRSELELYNKKLLISKLSRKIVNDGIKDVNTFKRELKDSVEFISFIAREFLNGNLMYCTYLYKCAFVSITYLDNNDAISRLRELGIINIDNACRTIKEYFNVDIKPYYIRGLSSDTKISYSKSIKTFNEINDAIKGKINKDEFIKVMDYLEQFRNDKNFNSMGPSDITLLKKIIDVFNDNKEFDLL